MFMASIIVIFYLGLLLGKRVHFESSTQLCLPRRKTEQFLLGEPHSGHIRAAVTAAKLFCCCVANSAVSEGDHPALKKKRGKGKQNKTQKHFQFVTVILLQKKKNHSAQPYALDGMAQELHGFVFGSGHCCLKPVGDPFLCFCTLPPNLKTRGNSTSVHCEVIVCQQCLGEMHALGSSALTLAPPAVK